MDAVQHSLAVGLAGVDAINARFPPASCKYKFIAPDLSKQTPPHRLFNLTSQPSMPVTIALCLPVIPKADVTYHDVTVDTASPIPPRPPAQALPLWTGSFHLLQLQSPSQVLPDDHSASSDIPRASIIQPMVEEANPTSSVQPPKALASYGATEHEHVKRPMNSFMVWAKKTRRELARQFPELHNAEVSRELGRIWRAMTPAERRPFEEAALTLKERHREMYPSYRFDMVSMRDAIGVLCVS